MSGPLPIVQHADPTPATLHTADAVPKEGRLDLTEDMAVPQNEPDDSSVALGHKDPEPQAALTRSAAQVSAAQPHPEAHTGTP